MEKMSPSPFLTEQHKLVSSTQIKRSLTPRRRAREYALQGIYQTLMMQKSGGMSHAHDIIKQLGEDPAFAKAQYALFESIFVGVCKYLEVLQREIQQHLDRPMDELSPIELSCILIGAYELKFDLATPYKVAINEAVELGKTFGGTDGHKYVNGILDQIAQKVRIAEIQQAS
jgi:N utilization substance protein B